MANSFIMVDALTALNAVENLGCLAKAVGRIQDRGRLSDGFGRCMAEELLGCAIPTNDDTVEIITYDRVVGRVDDRSEPRPLFFVVSTLADIDESETTPLMTPLTVRYGRIRIRKTAPF